MPNIKLYIPTSILINVIWYILLTTTIGAGETLSLPSFVSIPFDETVTVTETGTLDIA